MKPPESIESVEDSRPTGEEGCRRAAAATEGVASPVGSSEAEVRSRPQRGQADASATSFPHWGQRTRPEIVSRARGVADYIFFSAAGFFETLPSIIELQVFPSAEVSSLKS